MIRSELKQTITTIPWRIWHNALSDVIRMCFFCVCMCLLVWHQIIDCARSFFDKEMPNGAIVNRGLATIRKCQHWFIFVARVGSYSSYFFQLLITAFVIQKVRKNDLEFSAYGVERRKVLCRKRHTDDNRRIHKENDLLSLSIFSNGAPMSPEI